jgi:hypothetical protein
MNTMHKVRLTDAEASIIQDAMRDILIARARARQLITYSELASLLPVEIHPHSFAFSRLLRAVCAEEQRQGHGQLCALVVSKATGMPSGGYFVGTASPARDLSDLEAAWRQDLEALYLLWEKL